MNKTQNLMIENAQLKLQIKKLENQLRELSNKEIQFAKILDKNQKKIDYKLKELAGTEKQAMLIMDKMDELKYFLSKSANGSGEIRVQYNGQFILDTVPKIYFSGTMSSLPPVHLQTISRFIL